MHIDCKQNLKSLESKPPRGQHLQPHFDLLFDSEADMALHMSTVAATVGACIRGNSNRRWKN